MGCGGGWFLLLIRTLVLPMFSSIDNLFNWNGTPVKEPLLQEYFWLHQQHNLALYTRVCFPISVVYLIRDIALLHWYIKCFVSRTMQYPSLLGIFLATVICLPKHQKTLKTWLQPSFAPSLTAVRSWESNLCFPLSLARTYCISQKVLWIINSWGVGEPFCYVEKWLTESCGI